MSREAAARAYAEFNALLKGVLAEYVGHKKSKAARAELYRKFGDHVDAVRGFLASAAHHLPHDDFASACQSAGKQAAWCRRLGEARAGKTDPDEEEEEVSRGEARGDAGGPAPE